ncbi:glycosyltransferase family 1 protein [Pusillimonas caeni]|uniref:glycosyltransferase family 4 protein n=1 Tax=Pusillimonas caeni TaxID=1348472 RepID=UPI000E59D08F|nr:glycosyltransferase family 1 protein [Pusillimonas caeni]TFL11380.1 glycosyltransferase family 1 protein [Pusillimonas caeni]
MKVLIVTDAWAPQVNGVVFTLGQTCRELVRMGHQVEVLQPGLFRSVPCPSYREIRLSVPRPGAVGRLIRRHAPDALHIATEGPLGLAARRHARRLGLPFTTAYHTRFPEYLHARTRLPLSISYCWLRRFHGAAVRTMVPTAGVRDDLLAHGFDPAKVVIWSRGVDLEIFKPTAMGAEADGTGPRDPEARGSERRKSEPRDATVRHSKRPVFLYAGRVAVEKNLDAFLSLDLPGEKWVIGGGPALESMKKRYPDARYFGPMPHDELARHYRMADVFVFPSLTDTFGLVLLEAMACGCPVASLPARSTRDVLADSGAGVVSDDLRQACLQALSIPREIPARYAQGFSWQATTSTFFRHLQPIGRG